MKLFDTKKGDCETDTTERLNCLVYTIFYKWIEYFKKLVDVVIYQRQINTRSVISNQRKIRISRVLQAKTDTRRNGFFFFVYPIIKTASCSCQKSARTEPVWG